MATVVNNPGTSDSNNTLGTVFAIIALLIVVFLFLYYGLPALTRQGGSAAPQPQQQAPVIEGGDAGNSLEIDVPDEVNVPENVDVNIQ